LANPADDVAASASASGKIWGNLMRMIVVTPSTVGSFVVLTDGVLGNGNGIDILIQKDRLTSGTSSWCGRLSSNGKKSSPGFY
jgi:hypothetical protein